jgi:pimeloyl-ACP methyl ester carboxylesterase
MKNRIILLHGALGAIEQFDELKSLLSDDYDVYDFNFSGHGGDISSEEFTLDLFVNDTLKYMQNSGIATAHIFGYSMGGYVALKFASLYPDKVEKLITLATKYKWNPEIAQKEIKMLNPDVIEEKVPKFAQALKNRHYPEDWKKVMMKTANFLESLGNNSQLDTESLKNICSEVLVCLGSEDNMVTHEESIEIAELLPKGNFMTIDGFKHPLESVNKIKLAEIIKAFF